MSKQRKDYSKAVDPLMRVNRKNLGKALKYNRKIKAMSQMDLFQDTGVQTYVISQIETGKGNPKLQTIGTLFAGLGMTLMEGYSNYMDFVRRLH